MIRPVTLVTAMMMLGSGAWMFVVKHRAEQLDHRIGHVTGRIRASEQRIRVLRAEWALETDPNRLQRLAAMFMPQLKPMTPAQLVTWDQLADRLPPPGAKVPSLPLPPPLPDQLPAHPPVAAAPAVVAANAPVGAPLPPPPPAAPSRPPAKASVQLAASHAEPPRKAVPAPPAGPRHRTIAPHRVARAHPAPMPYHQSSSGREAANRPQQLGSSVLGSRAVSRPMGARVVSITAREQASPAPAPAPAPAPRRAVRHVAQSSVFGDYGSNLPPPQPVGGGSR